MFLHGGNAGNINEHVKDASVKGGRDTDGDGLGFESEDGREGAVTGVKQRRLDDFWRMELKRSVGLCCSDKCLLTISLQAWAGGGH